MKYDISSDIDDTHLHYRFPQSLIRLHSLVEKDDTSAAIAEGVNLQKLFDQLLQSADPDAAYQIRSSLTEIHRLLRILNRDLLFWKGAKQSRIERGAKVLETLQAIESFYQFLSANKSGAV
jgi:hypothetical protein